MTIPVLTRMSQDERNYRLILCDLWGVIHNGQQAFPAAVDCLHQLAKSGAVIYLVSNAPRPSSTVVPQLRRLGVDDACYHALVTSGDITRMALMGEAQNFGPTSDHRHIVPPGSTCFHIGPDRDLALFDGMDCERLTGTSATSLRNAEFILCTGLFDDETETVADYLDLLTEAAKQGLTMVCANPDVTVMRGTNLIPCAGAVAEAYQSLGGNVLFFGKPYPEVYNYCLHKWGDGADIEKAQGALQAEQVLAIGDSFRTDIAGASKMGFKSVLITEGIHSEEFGASAGQIPSQNKIEQVCADAGLAPDAVMASLVW